MTKSEMNSLVLSGDRDVSGREREVTVVMKGQLGGSFWTELFCITIAVRDTGISPRDGILTEITHWTCMRTLPSPYTGVQVELGKLE